MSMQWAHPFSWETRKNTKWISLAGGAVPVVTKWCKAPIAFAPSGETVNQLAFHRVEVLVEEVAKLACCQPINPVDAHAPRFVTAWQLSGRASRRRVSVALNELSKSEVPERVFR